MLIDTTVDAQGQVSSPCDVVAQVNILLTVFCLLDAMRLGPNAQYVRKTELSLALEILKCCI